ncbi:MAG: molybdopterin oxidoreductase family protein [Thermodesulfobacteriota bacterium]
MTNSIPEIEDVDCLLVVGSNTTEAHPLISHRMYRAKLKGAKLIVVDPRKIQLALHADIHIRIKFGTDVAFINGMMHAILANNRHNQAFIDERTEGFAELREHLKTYPPEKASEICGVPAEDIVRVAEIYANSERSSICYTLGITEHSHGVDNVKSLANLAMLTGQIGRPSTGVNPMRGQNNVQGACDMGGLPNVYPGYQAVTDDSVREKFEHAWQAKLSGKVGYTIPDMMDRLMDGTLKCLYILGENSVLSDPNTHHVTHALKSAEFLIVQDIFLTETARLAHVVLPGACWAEKEGTFTNTERKVQRVRKAVDHPDGAIPDWKIIAELGTRMGLSMSYEAPSEVFDEMASLSPIFGGINHQRLEAGGIQWPCPSPDHPGTAFLHQGKFTRGRGLFHVIDYRPSEELPDSDYPFLLTTGRRYAHYHTRTMTGRCPSLHKEFPEPHAQINHLDAQRLGLTDGDVARVVSRRGEVLTPVRLGDIVPEGAIFMDFHFASANPNELLGTSLDPVSKTPDYKVCAVKVEKMEEESKSFGE